jgi:hypothetical protein
MNYSAAGNWLFSSRRWRDPTDVEDRAALETGYDMLTATFPTFSSCCSRAHFLATIANICSGWSRSTRQESDNPPNSPSYFSKPIDEEGSASGAAGSQATRRDTSGGGCDGGSCHPAAPVQLQGEMNASHFALDLSCGTAEQEAIRVSPYQPSSTHQFQLVLVHALVPILNSNKATTRPARAS